MMIRDLAYLRKIKLDRKKLNTLKTLIIRKAYELKDILVHGVYVPKPEGGWHVLQTTGTWADDSEVRLKAD